MPDYMYLLENRLSPEQNAALVRVRELAQSQAINVYLTGGGVRDLLSGAPIHDLDFTVEGNPTWIVRELEKGGAQILAEDSRLREFDLLFHGDVDGSVAAAREEAYSLPGTRPELHWSTIMEDLRRRDFSLNSVAISLNPASRGLLLDPTNGLADIERREVRALSIHCFTNRPVRLLRILRYAARLGFKIESRTQEWYDLAVERGLHAHIPPGDTGRELRQLGAEEQPAAILKSWQAHGLLPTLHPNLDRRHPDYDGLGRLAHMAEQMTAAGLRVRLFAPVAWYLFRHFSPRERASALHRLELRPHELAAVAKLEAATRDAARALKARQTDSPRDAFDYLDRMPRDVLAFLQAEFPSPQVTGKIRNYLHKWRPLRLHLPAAELEALGIVRGPQFDRILDHLFELQLKGKGRTPIDRTRLLRQLAGVKPEPKKRERKKSAKPANLSAPSTTAPAAKSNAPERKQPAHGPAAAPGASRQPKTSPSAKQAAPARASR
jgi:tRNA nucleotidyltransferase/poly(A) polymerase